MTTPVKETRELGGGDPLDAELGASPPAVPIGALAVLLRSRAALGLAPAAAPALVFLPLGFLLGPRALGILSEPALAHLDVAVSVALAALGVFVGLGLDVRRRGAHRMVLPAMVDAGVTLLVVLLAAVYLLRAWQMPIDLTVLATGLTLGVCAAASSAGAAELSSDPVHQAATQVADLDDVLPVLVGGMLLAYMREPGVTGTLALTGFTAGIGLVISLAGWLLFERTSGDAERGVFVLGTVLLLGGSTAYVGLSPLLAGMAAGAFWTFSAGEADRIILRDLRRFQHPLVVLLLLTGGASIVPSIQALWLLVLFVLFRLAGKLMAGWLASRLVPDVAPADLGAYLIPPGVMGIAFALNVHQVTGSATATALVTAVVIGSVASEILALLALPAAEAR